MLASKLARLFAMAGTAMCVAVAPASAQVHSHQINTVIPQRRVVPPNTQGQHVAIKAVSANVAIKGQVASTTVRVVLRNTSSIVQESEILMPVTDGATIRSFELEGLGESGMARILPRDEARRIYDGIVRQARDPGLLEFAGYNLLRSSVFPVPANGEQAVNLTYEQVLPADMDRVDYILPRSEALNDLGIAWSFEVSIKSERPISTVYSPSHDITTDRISSNHVVVRVPQHSAKDPGALRVSYLLERPNDGVTATMVAYPDGQVGGGQGGYFMLLAGLPVERPADLAPVKREVILVLDRSGSMRNGKMDQAREAALQVIEGLSDGEAFNIIDYSDSIETFSAAPVIKGPETLTQARGYLKALTPNGGTNIKDALVEALRQPVTPGALPMVLFLTDGLPTVGERRETAIRDAAVANNPHHRRIFTFGVGLDVNTPLLSRVAEASRAVPTYVLPDEDVEVKVGQVFRRLSGPVLSSPVLTILDKNGQATTRAARELFPVMLPDFFEGDQITLLGQYTSDEPVTFRLTGDYFGKQRAFEFGFAFNKATTRNAYVPRLWASRKIAALIDEIRQNAADAGIATSQSQPDNRAKELIDEIVRLSTTWGILTEYTAFLATEPGMAGLEGSLGVPVTGAAPSAPAREAGAQIRDRVSDRAGSGAVNQEENLWSMKQQAKLNMSNRYLDKDLKAVECTTVRQVQDCTLYNRAGQWIDARVFQRPNLKEDAVVEYGTPAWDSLLDKLIVENRQSVLSVGGEIYLYDAGKVLLVRGPDCVPAK